jgi:hypothetical protein
VHHPVAAAAVEADAHAGVEMDRVVVKQPVVAAGEHQPVHAACDGDAPDEGMLAVFQVHRSAVAQPLVLVVLVVAEPVAEIFPLPDALEAGPPVVAEIAIEQAQAVHALGHDGDFETPHDGVFGRTAELVGPLPAMPAVEHGTVEIDRDIFTFDGEHGLIEAVGPGE